MAIDKEMVFELKKVTDKVNKEYIKLYTAFKGKHSRKPNDEEMTELMKTIKFNKKAAEKWANKLSRTFEGRQEVQDFAKKLMKISFSFVNR